MERVETVAICIALLALALVLSRSVTIRVGRHEEPLSTTFVTGDEALAEMAAAHMTPEQARELAQKILDGADEAERKRRS